MGIVKHLQEEFDYEIVDEFLDHYEVMIQMMENAIMALSSVERYKDEVEELFRIFHNLKSASGFLHLDSMHKLSALVEQILEELRTRHEPAPQSTIDWLLAVSDQYAQWQDDLSHDKSSFTPVDYHILNLPQNG